MKVKNISSSAIDLIISQYTSCVSKLDELFAVAPDECWKQDGVGCCQTYCDITTEYSDTMPAAVKDKLLRQRVQILREENGVSRTSPCQYHQKGFGCMLGNFKPAVCISHYCYGSLDSLRDESGKRVYNQMEIYFFLETILEGAPDFLGRLHPERNDEKVEQFRGYIAGLIEMVKSKATSCAQSQPF